MTLCGREDLRRLLDRFWLTVHSDRCIRTYKRTIDASRAVILDEDCKPITTTIDLTGETEAFLRASLNTQFTTFTDIFVNDHRTTYHTVSKVKEYLFFALSGTNPVPRPISLKSCDDDKKQNASRFELAKLGEANRSFPNSINFATKESFAGLRLRMLCLNIEDGTLTIFEGKNSWIMPYGGMEDLSRRLYRLLDCFNTSQSEPFSNTSV